MPYLAIAFEHQQEEGSQEHYLAAGLPRPAALSQSFDVTKWRERGETWEGWAMRWFQEAIEAGIRGLVLGIYGGLPAEFPVETQRILTVAARYPWNHVALRPQQEFLSGISKAHGLTPRNWKALALRQLDQAREAGLPVRAVLAHGNRYEGAVECMADVPGVEWFYATSHYEPGWPQHGEHGGNLHRVDEGGDLVSKLHALVGPVWLAEVGVFADFAMDRTTGAVAAGLRCPGVVGDYLGAFPALREQGKLAGLTWMNKQIYFSGSWMDGRIDARLTHPALTGWFNSEFARYDDLPD